MNTNSLETGAFQLLSPEQLTEINGGGFAYDFGRFIRFIAIAAPGFNPAMTSYAINDWIATDIVNGES